MLRARELDVAEKQKEIVPLRRAVRQMQLEAKEDEDRDRELRERHRKSAEGYEKNLKELSEAHP